MQWFTMRLNYYRCGEGFPLVILHGLFGSSDNWQTLSKRFKERYEVFALDLRNHGNSPHHNDVGYPAMARDVAEFLDEHQLAEAFILGHSMGGKVAMQFANDFPDLVRRLVVADIAPRGYPRYHDDVFAAMLSLDLGQYRSRGEVDRALASRVPDTPLRQFLLKNLANTETGTLKWKINLQGLYVGYDAITAAPPLTRKFPGPTLFVRGEKSSYIQTEEELLIQERWYPAASFVTIKDAGHWLHAEKPDEFFQVVREFLIKRASG